MSGISRAYGLLILIALFSVSGGCATAPSAYRDLRANGVRVADDYMYRELPGQRVIFVGEAHDEKRDHVVQRRVIETLVQSRRPVVIALEMFPFDAQESLISWNSGEMTEAGFRSLYGRHWNVPYSQYADIFEYARKAGIPLVGLNLKPGQVKRVGLRGPSAIEEDIRRTLGYRDCRENGGEFAELVGVGNVKHAHRGSMSWLCDAQLFRDSVMGYRIHRLLGDTSAEVTVVVILGAAHSLRPAVPSMMLRHTGPTPYLILTPKSVSRLIGRPLTQELADYTW